MVSVYLMCRKKNVDYKHSIIKAHTYVVESLAKPTSTAAVWIFVCARTMSTNFLKKAFV